MCAFEYAPGSAFPGGLHTQFIGAQVHGLSKRVPGDTLTASALHADRHIVLTCFQRNSFVVRHLPDATARIEDLQASSKKQEGQEH